MNFQVYKYFISIYSPLLSGSKRSICIRKLESKFTPARVGRHEILRSYITPFQTTPRQFVLSLFGIPISQIEFYLPIWLFYAFLARSWCRFFNPLPVHVRILEPSLPYFLLPLLVLIKHPRRRFVLVPQIHVRFWRQLGRPFRPFIALLELVYQWNLWRSPLLSRGVFVTVRKNACVPCQCPTFVAFELCAHLTEKHWINKQPLEYFVTFSTRTAPGTYLFPRRRPICRIRVHWMYRM